MNVVPTIKYMKLTLRHKWYVFVAGRRTRVSLVRRLKHDMSKFSPAEAPHYGRQYFGRADDPVGFSRAWNHHQKSNKHHWEYWILETGHDKGGFKSRTALEIPEKYVREMAADWLAASRVADGRFPTTFREWGWWKANFKNNIRLHNETRKLMMSIMSEALQR